MRKGMVLGWLWLVCRRDGIATNINCAAMTMLTRSHLTLQRVIGGGATIAAWNDAPERTPEEVEAAMLKAAAKLLGET